MADINQTTTNNLDADSDSLTGARAEIYSHIQATNSLIDNYDFSNPQEGDILIYSSGKYRATSVPTTYQMAAFTITGANLDINEVLDPNNLITVDSASDQFSVNDAGNYLIEALLHPVKVGVPLPTAPTFSIGGTSMTMTQAGNSHHSTDSTIHLAGTYTAGQTFTISASGHDSGTVGLIKVTKF